MIYPIADQLNISRSRVFANNLLFDDGTGDYTGFDENEPTSRSGGKRRVVEMLIVSTDVSFWSGHMCSRLLRTAQEREGYDCVIMVGDGVTDMEARPPASLFIGFGGNVVRDAVRDKADWFVHDFATLSAALA